MQLVHATTFLREKLTKNSEHFPTFRRYFIFQAHREIVLNPIHVFFSSFASLMLVWTESYFDYKGKCARSKYSLCTHNYFK